MTTQHFMLKAALLSFVSFIAVFSFARYDGRHFSGVDNDFMINKSANAFPAILFEEAPMSLQILSQMPRSQTINHIVRAGETLSSLWEQYGGSARHAVAIVDELKNRGLEKLGLKRGESVVVALSPEGQLVNFEKRLDDGRTILVKRSDDENFETQIVPAEFEIQERVVSGTIQDSLAATAQSIGVSYGLVDDVVDLFSSRIRFTKDIQPGDSFAIKFKEKRCKRDGSLIGDPTVEEASFDIGGKLMAVFGVLGKDGKTQYVDESGETMGSFFLRYPLTFTRISSTFTYARFHPVLQRSRPHMGVDFAAPIGTPVRAVGDGTILEIGFKTEPGNWIKIQHSDRWSTAYMHLSSFAPGLKKGMHVSRGQLIGAVGATGLATGPHLHFSLYDNAKYVDPLTTDLPRMDNLTVQIPKAVMVQRLEVLKALHEKTRLLAFNTAKPKHLS